MDPEIKTITLTCYEYERYVRMAEKVAVICRILSECDDSGEIGAKLLKDIIGEP